MPENAAAVPCADVGMAIGVTSQIQKFVYCVLRKNEPTLDFRGRIQSVHILCA